MLKATPFSEMPAVKNDLPPESVVRCVSSSSADSSGAAIGHDLNLSAMSPRRSRTRCPPKRRREQARPSKADNPKGAELYRPRTCSGRRKRAALKGTRTSAKRRQRREADRAALLVQPCPQCPPRAERQSAFCRPKGLVLFQGAGRRRSPRSSVIAAAADPFGPIWPTGSPFGLPFAFFPPAAIKGCGFG